MRILFIILMFGTGFFASAFEAKNQDGKTMKLSDFKGKYVLLYFYPKDDTSGCTTEAKNFTRDSKAFAALNVVVLGVSSQDEKSHREFKEKYSIPYDLLVDADGSLAKKYSVGLMPLIGLHKRESVLLGKNGEILKTYRSVDPETHSAQVMKDVRELGN